MDLQLLNEHFHRVTHHIDRIRWTFPILLAVQLASISLLCERLPKLQFYSLAGATVLFLLLGMWVRPYRTFGILMTILLMFGFTLVFLAWEGHWSPWKQITWLINHALTLILGTSTWMETLILHRVFVRWIKAEEELSVLRKFDPDGVLTLHEFLYQLQDVVTAMARRGEHGVLLVIDAIAPFSSVAEAAIEKVATILLTSVRGRYDLVGRQSPTRLLVALQNVTDAGISIIENRLWNAIHEVLTNADDIVRMRRIELNGPWESVHQTLQEHGILPDIQTFTQPTLRKASS